MITFKCIRYKNFLSTGNHFTEINFNGSAFNTLIVGNNGAGKSTLLDALRNTNIVSKEHLLIHQY